MRPTPAPTDQKSTDDWISELLAAETPLWMRLVRECEEQLKSEATDAESELDPFEELQS